LKHFIILNFFLVTTCCTFAQTASFIASNEAIEDINQMITTFEQVHYNPYFRTSKQEFNAIKEDLLEHWTSDSISYK